MDTLFYTKSRQLIQAIDLYGTRIGFDHPPSLDHQEAIALLDHGSSHHAQVLHQLTITQAECTRLLESNRALQQQCDISSNRVIDLVNRQDTHVEQIKVQDTTIENLHHEIQQLRQRDT